GMVTSIARLDGDQSDRLAQVLDVETILRQVMPSAGMEIDPERIGPKVDLKPGSVILAADDSLVARTMIEEGLTAMGLPYIMCKTGKEAWDQLQAISSKAQADGHAIGDKIALVLTSSLTGAANEAHVKKVGADGYVAKFVAEDLAKALRNALRGHD
ncbi:MAG: chemotaxis protein CheV, partial [Hydrogenophilales bacterium 17-61-76]